MVGKIGNFFREVKVEMKKVTWPTRGELRESTKQVIIATFVVTEYLGIVDKVHSHIIRYLLGW